MRLLITRAVEDAARTRDTLEAAGHAVLVSPVLIVQTLPVAWPEGAYSALVVTSARGFQAPSPDRLRALPLFVVGARTEAAARRCGFRGPAHVAASGAALVEVLCSRPAMDLLYLAGQDRKAEIETGLHASAHRLRTVETYRAAPAPGFSDEALAALRHGALDTLPHYSRRSAALVLALAAKAGLDITGLTHVCLSHDVAAPLREAGCARVLVAATPTEDSLLALLALPPGQARPA